MAGELHQMKIEMLLAMGYSSIEKGLEKSVVSMLALKGAVPSAVGGERKHRWILVRLT